MNMRGFVILVVLCLASGCEPTPSQALVASEIKINRPLPGIAMSAGYLALANQGTDTIRITSFSSPQFASVELHETIIKGDIASMRALPELEILPGQTVSLVPGGKHLMLMGPKLPLDRVTLNIYAGNELLLSVSAAAVVP